MQKRLSFAMSLQDPPADRMGLKSDHFPPKLRKNRKIELRWGNDYYDAVNKAVFSNEYLPYMPSEPPASIKEDFDKTGYVCKQCKDCFRFLSSIEEHTSRRSWVLGYWCQACFTTKCTHPGQYEMCSSCRNVEASKHAYLAEKGVRRNLKKAVTRVFYNQCQFFAHLRGHGILVVDLSEVMLMPLPSGIQRQDYGQLDRLCKALMETMFIRRVHIMDWLRQMNIHPNRWNTVLNWMESKKKTPITDILGRYSEDCLNTMDLAARTRKDALARKTVVTGDSSSNSRSGEKDPLAEDDEDESPNNIAFVDCGPTPSHAVVSEFPEVRASKDSDDNRTSDRANSLWRSFSQQYGKQKDKPREIAPKPSEKPPEPVPPAAINNRKSPRILTIRSPRSLSLSTIMKHLPVDAGAPSRKNIFVLANDSKPENSLSSGSNSPAITNPSLALELKSKEKAPTSKVKVAISEGTKTSPGVVKSSTSVESSLGGIPLITKSQSFSEQMSLHGRIVFQNGRKYIIRHVAKSKSQSILQDSVKKFHNPPPLIAPLSGTKIPLLPKPTPVTQITPAATNKITVTDRTQQKSNPISRASRRLKVPPKVTNPSGFSLTTVNASLTSQNNKSRITKMQKSLIVKCREGLLNDLRRASKSDLQTYIEHLKSINERYSKTSNFESDTVLANNARAIERFECVAKYAKNCQPASQDSQSQDIFERNTREWETRTKDMDKQRACDTCSKRVKPSSYIVGMSVPAIDETLYCQCYNNICYICNANQGNLIQLKAHVRWHKGEKPYMCPSCSIVFPSTVELEIHIWTSCFHPMARCIYGCSVCEIEGILDMETVAKHYLLLHTQKKIICAECKMEYSGTTPTYTDYRRHFNQHHRDIDHITEPKRLLVCNLKQCIVRPELFRVHLSDHVGVLKCIYYKCPFCSTISQSSGRNKSLMRQHLIDNHLDRMHEIVSKDSLEKVIDGIKLTPPIGVNVLFESVGEVSQVLNADPTGPKILDARTIDPATFELGTEEPTTEIVASNLPRILEVRSEAVEEFEPDETRTNDFKLEILSVKSMADCSFDSPAVESETSSLPSKNPSHELINLNDTPKTITLRVDSSLVREHIECEDSSNSHDDITVISMNSKGDDSELEHSTCSLEPCDEIRETDVVTNDYDSSPHLKALLTSDRITARPWRIALNSPTNVEAEPIHYNCHLCGELVSTSWSVIKNHFDTRHSSDYEIFTVSPNIPRIRVNNLIDEPRCRDDSNGCNKRKNEISPPATVPKRRRRWGPKKHVDRPGSPSSLGICVKPEPIEEIEGNYRCKKCDEPFKDRDKLREHIALQHRIKGQYLICLECGENFVVVPSLQMHLKALHGIQDPITYLTKHTAYAPEVLDDTEEDEKATESNQCYVCMAVFENKPALDKHIRVHGMAFLRRKRFEAQKALKSSQKTNDSSDVSPKIESTDEKSISDVGSVKMEIHEGGVAAPSSINESSTTNQIQEVIKIIAKMEKIDPLPIT